MKKILVSFILAILTVCAYAGTVYTPTGQFDLNASAKPYCLTATPTAVQGAYFPVFTTFNTPSGVAATIDEKSTTGDTYRTTLTYTDGARTTLSTVSCPIKQ